MQFLSKVKYECLKASAIAGSNYYRSFSYGEEGDFGLDGYRSDDLSQLNNYLLKFNVTGNELKLPKFEKFAILTNMWVDEDVRGEGLGTEMLDNFLHDVKDVDIIFLIADAQETQKKGFNLEKWYASKKFKKIKDTSAGALMVKIKSKN